MKRPRLPGFGFALTVPFALLVSGCGASLQAEAKASGGAAPPMDAAMAPGQEEAAPAMPAPPPPVAMASPAGAPGMMAVDAPAPQPMVPGTPGVATAAPQPVAVQAPSREMLDIEANIEMQVSSAKQGAKALHALAAKVGGVVTAERLDTSSQYGTATLTLRIPSSATHGVLEDLEKLGSVLTQTITARDIGKEFFDASLRLSSLEATLHRYEQILAKADKVEEILRIEQELSRIRNEIEQVKGNLRWLSDRAARATLHLTLREKVPEVVHDEPEPEPKFYPGLRAPLLLDFGKQTNQTYAGGGISVRALRSFSVDLDLVKRLDSKSRGPDALIATLGGEIYSNLLGAGERHYLNPYLGWRAGYARFEGHHQALVGATLGLELYKNSWFDLDVEARNHLLFGGELGAHYALEPALAASVAF